MIRNGEGSLDAAAGRLARAVDALEARLAARAVEPAPATDASASEALEIELREARMRERALEGAAAEASMVLGRAAEQIRAALEDEDGELDAAGDAEMPDDRVDDDKPASLDHLSDDQTDFHPSTREF